MGRDISKKSNKELEEYRVKLKEDFELVRRQLIHTYDHWDSINKEYLKVVEELNSRYGIK